MSTISERHEWTEHWIVNVYNGRPWLSCFMRTLTRRSVASLLYGWGSGSSKGMRGSHAQRAPLRWAPRFPGGCRLCHSAVASYATLLLRLWSDVDWASWFSLQENSGSSQWRVVTAACHLLAAWPSLPFLPEHLIGVMPPGLAPLRVSFFGERSSYV